MDCKPHEGTIQDGSLLGVLCRANTGLLTTQSCSLSASWRERWGNKGTNSCPNVYERPCPHAHLKMSEWDLKGMGMERYSSGWFPIPCNHKFIF